ncbi:amino acid ABC transporter substrate-binding protein [Prauserella cavernicola]|uniref:Amino acid ABC transporter substrate-binding protein n=1 Tax=Prauserella cavernicola TaxID=2800127 RepID=A0A934QNJ1_9PSEU|nr:amino acid ABC transporter substrate-binding protein [Prauserella cavernicola]MBK1783212.1 amino acid ABC transporter substrate-binding protein [Prauserella cavernicola]
MWGRRARAVVAGLAGLGLLAAGCAKPPVADDPNGPIRIGAAVSDTGKYSIEGQAVKHGYELWADMVNDELGGIQVGDRKRKVEMVYYDDQSDPEQAVRLTQRLISEDGIDFIFGSYSSGLTLAASAVTEPNQRILFAGGAAADTVFSQGSDYVFSPLTNTSRYTESALRELAKRGAKTVGILHTDEAPMVDIQTATEKLAGELGMRVVGTQRVPSDANDIRGAVTQLRQSDPDVLVEAGHTLMGVLTVQTMRSMSWAPEYVVMIQAPTEPGFVEQLGAAATEGIMAPTQWHSSAQFSDEYFGTAGDYRKRYVERYGEEPSYMPPSGSAVALSLQLAIEKAGSVDVEKVREALLELDTETFYGRINYSGEGDPSGLKGANVTRPMLTIQLNAKGEQVVVAPEENASAEIVPMKPWSQR